MPAIELPRDCGPCRLRRLQPADTAAFQRYRAVPELGRYQGWQPMADEAARAFLAEMAAAPLFAPGAWVQLGIAEAGSDALVGDIGLFLAADGCSGEVGFTLAPWAQGQGLATAAVREAVRLLFEATPATRVQAISDARNTPSLRLLERLGFVLVETCDAVFRGEACVEKHYVLAREALAAGPGTV